MAALVQQALGPSFVVERELGGGGVARVVVARDVRMGRQVVVKLLSQDQVTPDRVERFRREIQIALPLQHPHIVPILAAGEVEGIAYLTMPFVEGESLRSRLSAGPLPVVETVRLLRGIALALAYAHARGVVHRDIKPDNVLVAGGIPMVADFGIAKAIAGTRTEEPRGADPTLTMAGTSIGTPTYMAPEQIVASPDANHRADIYAVGVLAYEALAGAPPFRGTTPQQLFAAHLTERPAPLWEHRPDVPAALADLVMRCLAKAPDERPDTANELAAALESPEMVSGQFAAPPEVTAAIPTPRRRSGRRVAALAAAGVLALVVAIVLALGGLGSGRDGSETPAAAALPPTIAVLPLTPVEDDLRPVALALGDELGEALARVPAIQVMGRTRSVALQQSILDDEPLPDFLLGYVEGAVYREGAEVRVALRLVAANGVRIASLASDSAPGVRTIAATLATRIAEAIDSATPSGAGAARPR